MPESKSELKLTDLIDLEFLQKFQDSVALTAGVANIIVDENGPVTTPSNFTDFCIQYVKGSTLGIEKCVSCDIKYGELAAQKNEPEIYTCRSGLTNFAVPIVVDGKHYGSILGGQVFTEEPDEEHFREIAKKFGINEENYINAMREVKVVSPEHIKATANLLFVVANSISKIASEKLELIRKSESENFYRTIVETIRSSLDIDETRQKIVNIIGKTMKADRCFIAEYDKMTDKFSVMMDEYIAGEDIFTYKGIDINENFPNCTELIKKGEKIIINDKKFAINVDTENFYPENEAIKKYKELSLFAFPLYYSGELLGCLSISYIKEKHVITEDEINLVNIIADQIATAMYQAKLHKLTEEQAEREALLRRITETIRETLDIDKMKKRIVDIIGQTLKADRCFFMEYDPKADTFLTVKDEYISSNKIPKYEGADVNEDVPNFMEEFKKGSFLVVDNKEVFIDDEHQEFGPEREAINKFKVNSAYGFPFFHNGQLRGVLGLHYLGEEHKPNQDEISLLKLVADQIAISIDQAKLYQITQKQAEKEALLRKILSIIASSLDLDKVKYDIVNQVGMYLKADRVFFADYNPTTQKYSISETGEYLSSDKIQSLKSFDFVSIPGFAENIRSMHLKGIDIVFEDLDKYMEEKDAEASPLGDFFRTQGFMSLLAINMNYGDIYLGNIVISYAEKKKITEEDIAFVRTITDQASFAVYQAKLYKATQISAVREKLIGDVITKAISTFDLNEIKQIVNEVGVLTKADRCYFIEVDLDKSQGKPVNFDAEYLSSPEIKSIAGYKFSKEDVKNFVKIYTMTKDLIIFDYDLINQDQSGLYKGLQKYSKLFGLKTCIGIPLHYMGKLTSVLIIEYIKEKVIPSEDELDFLRILGNQIGMAFNQILLYQDTKKTAERETLLRKITENIRGSLDIEETLSFICEETAKLFNVQRTAITSFSNPKNYEEFTIRKEYRESPKVKGLFDVGNISKTSSYWVDRLKKAGSDSNILTFDNIQKSDAPDYFKKAYKSMGVKSMIGTTIKKGKNIWGTLVLSEYNYDRQWSEEEKILLKTIADQIYLAINQAELFSITKKQAEREVRLRNIIENIRSSLDIEKTLSFICKETARLFNVQRVALGSFFNLEDFHDYKMRKEYKADPKIKGFLELDNYIDIAAYWGSNLIGLGNLLAIDNIKESDMPDEFSKTYTSSGAKSIIGIAINKGKNNGGTLVLAEYNEYRHWTEEEKDLLKTIADQIYLAINQAELFEKERKTASNEKALREIMLSSVSTFEMEDVINSIVTQTGKLLNADRCFYVEIDLETHTKRSIKEYAEYLSSNDIKSHITRQPKNVEVEIFNEDSKQKKTMIVSDIRKIDLPESTKKMLMDDLSVKSYLIVPVFHGEIWYGSIVLHYVRDFKQFSQDEIDLVQAVASQAAVVINQAEVFKKEKKTADRERILGAISNKIRSSLDLEDVKYEIVNQVGKLLKADRVIIADIDPMIKNPVFTKKSEYRSSNKIKTLFGIDFKNIPGFIENIINVHLQGKDIIFSDLEEYLDENNLRGKSVEKFYRDYGFISSAAINMYYREMFLGDLVITFENQRTISNDEINLIKTISDQAGVAIYQAKLFESAKQTSERESTLRKAAEILRNTLDPEEIKQSFVNIISKYFDVDRCLFDEYNKKDGKFLPFKIEKLKSASVKSLVGTSVEEEFPEFVAKIKKGRSIILRDVEKTLSRRKFTNYKSIENLYKSDTKSDYGMAIMYKSEFIGTLILHYTEKKRILTHDEFAFLKVIMDQVGVALYQAELYQYTKTTAENESFQKSIVETIRSSLDIDETKRKIVNIIGKTLDADRCLIIDYDKTKDEFLPVKDEYLSSDKIPEYMGMDINKDVPKFAAAVKQGKPIIINNKEICLDPEGENFHVEREAIEKYHVCSAYAIPLYYHGVLLGILSIHYVDREHIIGENEINLMDTVANQVATAIYQANLYKTTQINAEREKLIGNILTKAISAFDVNQIKQMVTDVGMITKADRCYFVEVDLENMKGKPINVEREYLSSPDITSIVGYDFPTEDVRKFIEIFLEAKDLVIFDYEKIPSRKSEIYAGPLRYANLGSLQNSIGIPFYYMNKLVAILVVEYVKEKVIPSEDDLNFLRILGNQVGMAFSQIQLYQDTKKTAEREHLLRTIIETVRSSLNINEVKKNITEQMGKTFKADRCYFRSYDEQEGKFLAPDVEYLSSNKIKSLMDVEPDQEGLKYFSDEIKRQGKGFYPIVVDEESVKNTPLESYIKSADIKADYAIPIINKERDIVWLVLHYSKEDPKLDEEDKKLLETIAYQIDIAFEQIRLYNALQQTTAKQNAILNNMPFMAWLKDSHSRLLAVNNEFARMCGTTIENIIGKTDFDFFPKKYAETYVEEDRMVMKIGQTISSEDLIEGPTGVSWHETFKSPVFDDKGNAIGTAGIARDITERKQNDLELLRRQEQILKANERERLYREIMEAVRSSLDINETKKQIVNMVGKTFGADRCFIVEYDKENNKFLPTENEYLSSDDIISYTGAKSDEVVPNFVATFKNHKPLIINKKQIYIDGEKQDFQPEKEAIEKYCVYSALAIPLFYGEDFLGALSVHYVKEMHEISEDEIALMNMIADQVAIAIHQAKLFKLTKVQAEREKISRNIIEILRSSMDQMTIKRLFVKNIGKYFNADRVFFSNYDPDNKIYLPVDENSEYLSSPEEKSFIGFDWAKAEVGEFIQPLLERRELKITTWDEYVNESRNQNIKAIFEDAKVKSSYNFPVLYQQKMIGYFCIEFTHQITKLADEDINRIRSICTQAGIALYQAELYQKAQESDRIKGEFIANISSKFREPLTSIIGFSEKIPKTEIDCEKQAEQLETINKTSKKLLDFTNYISDASNTSLDKDMGEG